MNGEMMTAGACAQAINELDAAITPLLQTLARENREQGIVS